MVGIGPGRPDDMSLRAIKALKDSDLVVGYRLYLDLISDIIAGKPTYSSGMRKETERARKAIDEAAAGKIVSIVSSGDPGIYGMAGLALEIMSESRSDVPVEIIPGIPSASAAAALLGAPIMHDHAVISLSDLLTPWETIERRLGLAAKGDFIIVLYNPMSKKRDWQLKKAVEIFLRDKPPSTCVGIVRNASRQGESIKITTLDRTLENEIDMTTILIIGNSTSFVFERRPERYMVTSRGYDIGG